MIASSAAGTDPGWSSHLIAATSAEVARVWIQSTHGRRYLRRSPDAPSISIGIRSHHALKIAIVASAHVGMQRDRERLRSPAHNRASAALFVDAQQHSASCCRDD
jgi:hypothetical protein